MAARRSSRAERRALVERMLTEDHTRSDRSIARSAGASHTHVADVRRGLVVAGRIAARPCQSEVATQDGYGNLARQQPGVPSPALKHGAESETRLAGLRVRFEESLSAEFGQVVDARRLWLAADLLARVEAARAWLDAQGGVTRNRAGEVYAVVDRLERWGARADALLKELHALKREEAAVDPQAALDAYVAGLTGDGDGDGGA